MGTLSPPQLLPIRVATLKDARLLHELAAQALYEIDGINYDVDTYETFRNVFAHGDAAGACRIIVAHERGKPQSLVASGAAWIHQILPAAWLPNGKLGYLQWFYTAPAWRGRGIAHAIGEQLIAWLGQAGCTRVQLHAIDKAAPVYRRLGFEPTLHENFWLKLPTSPTTR
ncbi:MAG TPA: GNAT family N-acetyltransferase [Mycobacteriales bacterium]|jgi:GNAT superfamily N-acetyltransferase|nr:GNAT family N-acetyltransferase [Mycobacteriales bacterium]